MILGACNIQVSDAKFDKTAILFTLLVLVKVALSMQVQKIRKINIIVRQGRIQDF